MTTPETGTTLAARGHSQGGVVRGVWSEGRGQREVVKKTTPNTTCYLVLGISLLVTVEVVHKPLLQRLKESLHSQWEGCTE